MILREKIKIETDFHLSETDSLQFHCKKNFNTTFCNSVSKCDTFRHCEQHQKVMFYDAVLWNLLFDAVLWELFFDAVLWTYFTFS